MPSTHELHEDFNKALSALIEKIKHHENNATLISYIQTVSTQFEKLIQEKIQQLMNEFQQVPIEGDYLNTVTEGFTDLDRFLRKSFTLIDYIQIETSEDFGSSIKKYQLHTLIPLFNILAKLENDYHSIENSQTDLRHPTKKP